MLPAALHLDVWQSCLQLMCRVRPASAGELLLHSKTLHSLGR